MCYLWACNSVYSLKMFFLKMCFILYAIACLDKLLIEEGNKMGEYIELFHVVHFIFWRSSLVSASLNVIVQVDFNLCQTLHSFYLPIFFFYKCFWELHGLSDAHLRCIRWFWLFLCSCNYRYNEFRQPVCQVCSVVMLEPIRSHLASPEHNEVMVFGWFLCLNI